MSPPSVVVDRKRLSNYSDMYIDWCELKVMIHWTGSRAAPKKFMNDFLELLTRENIRFKRMPLKDPFYHNTVKLSSPAV